MPNLKKCWTEPILESMNRADLHALVDTLPEGALENAKRLLDRLQVWPPQRPPEVERMRHSANEQMERFRRSSRVGGRGGGYSYSGYGDGYGHCGHSRLDGDTVVIETLHFHKGHEIAVSERLRFSDDGTAILYAHEARGPKGEPVLSEMTFTLK